MYSLLVFAHPSVSRSAFARFGMWKGERLITDYLIALSGLGVVLSAYQKYLELGGKTIIPCSATAVSCSKSMYGIWLYHHSGHGAHKFHFYFVLMLMHNYITRRNSR